MPSESPALTVRNFTEADIPAFTELQQKYLAANPGLSPIHPQVLLSAYCGHGQYVCCAFSPAGEMQGCAWFYPQSDKAWVGMLVHSVCLDPGRLKDALLSRLSALARGAGVTRLAFQFFPFEGPSIAYAQGRGAVYAFTIYTMQRPLDEPIPEVAPPPGFSIRLLRLQEDNEQAAYLEARRVCFPDENFTLEALRFLVHSPLWAQGASVTGYSLDKLAGSVSVFWEPGSRIGFTESIFTLPPYRGKNLARALLARALVYLKASGLEAARLEVKAENESALALYTGLGYSVAAQSAVLELSL